MGMLYQEKCLTTLHSTTQLIKPYITAGYEILTLMTIITTLLMLKELWKFKGNHRGVGMDNDLLYNFNFEDLEINFIFDVWVDVIMDYAEISGSIVIVNQDSFLELLDRNEDLKYDIINSIIPEDTYNRNVKRISKIIIDDEDIIRQAVTYSGLKVVTNKW